MAYQPPGTTKQHSAVKTFWLTAGALGVITTILTVTLTKCMADKPASTATTTTVQTTAQATTTGGASTPTSAAPTTASSRFHKEAVTELRVPFPSCYTWVDLDVPKMTEKTGDSDVMYESCGYTGSLSHYDFTSLGVGPETEPASGEDCQRAAQSKALARVMKEDLTVGKAFCVVTTRDNVVWLKLRQKVGEQDGPDLVFDMVRWLG
ncbi:hypothetical protein Lesp02_21710 [Lentzea sp. NBRC 105346]|uniref:hypothetical protein n=1 Tax=Lentzea sp. NBRC 105346 TaxID=3032205 RepID=UPI0024A0E994|nr:hypothetical protein [Lentzea sp. NBRC 105346]GLZ29981.1 hypothetical protein Lesp02_21710 [Lentzea sp. NBRC 105346]